MLTTHFSESLQLARFVVEADFNWCGIELQKSKCNFCNSRPTHAILAPQRSLQDKIKKKCNGTLRAATLNLVHQSSVWQPRPPELQRHCTPLQQHLEVSNLSHQSSFGTGRLTKVISSEHSAQSAPQSGTARCSAPGTTTSPRTDSRALRAPSAMAQLLELDNAMRAPDSASRFAPLPHSLVGPNALLSALRAVNTLRIANWGGTTCSCLTLDAEFIMMRRLLFLMNFFWLAVCSRTSRYAPHGSSSNWFYFTFTSFYLSV